MIDTSLWGEFRIGNLFDVSRPNARSSQKYDKGNMPFVASGAFNNGIMDYLKAKDENDFDEGNCITVSPVDGYAFYQKDRFLGRGGAGSSIIILRNDNLNELRGKFLCTVIRFFCCNWNYSNMGNKDKLADTVIKLPVTSNGQPDWAYMESYMKQIMKESEKSLENLKKADGEKHSIDTRNWGSFRIGDLFDVVKGTRLTKANMKEGNIRFVGSSAMNNGETARIANDENLHPANTITVCYNGSVGETFYQDEQFWASDDVNVLYPLFTMNSYIAFFICPIIKSVGQKYAFIDKWKQETMKEDFIKLPITSKGKPDWRYMEDYMKNTMDNAEDTISALQSGLRG